MNLAAWAERNGVARVTRLYGKRAAGNRATRALAAAAAIEERGAA